MVPEFPNHPIFANIESRFDDQSEGEATFATDQLLAQEGAPVVATDLPIPVTPTSDRSTDARDTEDSNPDDIPADALIVITDPRFVEPGQHLIPDTSFDLQPTLENNFSDFRPVRDIPFSSFLDSILTEATTSDAADTVGPNCFPRMPLEHLYDAPDEDTPPQPTDQLLDRVLEIPEGIDISDVLGETPDHPWSCPLLILLSYDDTADSFEFTNAAEAPNSDIHESAPTDSAVQDLTDQNEASADLPVATLLDTGLADTALFVDEFLG